MIQHYEKAQSNLIKYTVYMNSTNPIFWYIFFSLASCFSFWYLMVIVVINLVLFIIFFITSKWWWFRSPLLNDFFYNNFFIVTLYFNLFIRHQFGIFDGDVVISYDLKIFQYFIEHDNCDTLMIKSNMVNNKISYY